MYREVMGRVHPYIEPFVSLGVSTDEGAGEPKSFGAGGLLGVDFMVFDQFSLGAQIGAGFLYTSIGDGGRFGSNGGSQFRLGLFTTSVNATFWFGS